MLGAFITCLLAIIASFTLTSCGSDTIQAAPIHPVNEVNNLVVLGNPKIKQVEEYAYYTLNLNGKPFINNAVIFAANINGSDPDKAYLYYNTDIKNILNTQEGLNVIRKLQSKGVKVHLAILGNHENAGWSCSMNADTIARLSQEMVDAVTTRNLDGIMIDDEYSKCSGDTQSFYNLVKAIKSNAGFTGKILSKALWEDDEYFKGATNVGPLLDQGYDMHYNGDISYLEFYVDHGMSKKSLGMGVYYQKDGIDAVKTITKNTIGAGYGGMMVFAPTDIPTYLDTAKYFSSIAKGEYGENSAVNFSYSTTGN